MTTRELNRDFNRLYLRLKKEDHQKVNNYQETEARLQSYREEIKRLYFASDSLRYANRKSILIFMDFNRKFRAIQFHSVFTYLDI